MSLDRYSTCPGGTGKKIKFCCNDLLHELQTIEKMLEGEQRLGCLEHIDKALKKYPDRACLLASKALVQNELEQDEGLRETLDRFDTVCPGNPVALAERAILLASHEGGRAGVPPLQLAIETVENELPTRVYEAIGYVGQILLSDGEILSAYAHLLLQAAIGGTSDTRAMSMLVPLIRSPRMPLLMKQEMVLSQAPEDAPWKKAFDLATLRAARGAWRAGERAFVALLEQAGDAAEVWRNIAVLRSWLSDNRQAVVAWQNYAALPDVDLEDAVEATAISQLIDPDLKDENIDVVRVSLPVADMEGLLGKTGTDGRAVRIPVEGLPPMDEGQPPPQAAFWIMDRPLPDTGVGLAREDVPDVFGQVFLFGKETDREARLEFLLPRDDRFEMAIETIKDVVGDAVTDASEENVVDQIQRLQNALSRSWRLPQDTPAEHRKELVRQQRRHAILDVWTSLSNPALDDQTPRQAADDEEYRIELLAAIMLLEWSSEEAKTSFDFNELRRELGQPELAPIAADQLDVMSLPLIRLARLVPDSLSDEQLITAYRRSVQYMATHAIRALAAEVVRRDSLEGKVDKAEAYGLLARLEEDSDRALAWLDEARNVSKAAGQSPAAWYLAELELRLMRGEQDEFQRVLTTLRNQHWDEPGVAAAVMQLFRDLGLVQSGAQPAAQPAAPAETEPVPAAEAGGKIWTPGSESQGPAKKSAIWTPDS